MGGSRRKDMTLRAADRYFVLERLRSNYDKTDTYIAEDPVSGQVIRLRHDPFDGSIGSISLDDITAQVNGGEKGRGPCERFKIDYENFVTLNSRGVLGVEYPIIHLDTDPAGFLYVRIYYDETHKSKSNDGERWYYGTIEFIEELFSTGEEEDDALEEVDETS